MKTGHGARLPRKWELAIASLLQAPTLAEAAALVGISAKTLRQWLADLDFSRAYRQARVRIVETAIGRLQHLAGKAVDTLADLLNSSHTPTRARAALGILDAATKAIELGDLVSRVEALEANQNICQDQKQRIWSGS